MRIRSRLILNFAGPMRTSRFAGDPIEKSVRTCGVNGFHLPYFANLGKDSPDDVNRCIDLNRLGANFQCAAWSFTPEGSRELLTQSADRSHNSLETDSCLH